MVETMKSKEEVLLELGLNKTEVKVILTLLKSGESTITEISRNSGLHRANVYETIEKLKDKSLINHIKKNNKKYFHAADPSNLLNMVKQKEMALQNILPQLEIDYKLASKSSVEIAEGVAGIRNVMQHYIKKGDDIYDFGVPKMAIPLVGSFFQANIHKQRAKKKQWMYHIYNSDAKERIDHLNSLPYTKAKYLPSVYDSPVTTRICGDEVSITLYSDNPVTIIIKNEKMAKAYKKYFQILWERAKGGN